ncbi:MAG TPA: hypothetical protein VFP68_13860 [Burkholderiaceae bacterium]|nr:hypothetical protein [Burkholderiaceae bacterium]
MASEFAFALVSEVFGWKAALSRGFHMALAHVKARMVMMWIGPSARLTGSFTSGNARRPERTP